MSIILTNGIEAFPSSHRLVGVHVQGVEVFTMSKVLMCYE